VLCCSVQQHAVHQLASERANRKRPTLTAHNSYRGLARDLRCTCWCAGSQALCRCQVQMPGFQSQRSQAIVQNWLEM
jgi:hypothetical protein